jgi:5,10-methylene-tetrahydrofolate dehydrogenase/methenyl tetrahydrofolate cyclohydrolase
MNIIKQEIKNALLKIKLMFDDKNEFSSIYVEKKIKNTKWINVHFFTSQSKLNFESGYLFYAVFTNLLLYKSNS